MRTPHLGFGRSLRAPLLAGMLTMTACTVTVVDEDDSSEDDSDDDSGNSDDADDESTDDDDADGDDADDDDTHADERSNDDSDDAAGEEHDDGQDGTDDSGDATEEADDPSTDDVVDDSDETDDANGDSAANDAGAATDDSADDTTPSDPDAGMPAPVCAAPEGLDTDGDGMDDGCDPDDDNDGFVDAEDPEPKNNEVPGDYSTPEKILADRVVEDALDELEEEGIEFPIHDGDSPPELSGYFRREVDVSAIIASGDGTDLTDFTVGVETRRDLVEEDLYDSVDVIFDETPVGFGRQLGIMVRGEDNEFTAFSLSKSTCTDEGADFDTWSVSIQSAQTDPATGDIIDSLTIAITIATNGARTAGCDERLGANTEQVGGWTASRSPLSRKVSVDELEFMCVDGGNGFAPPETWNRDDGTACQCSTEFAVACD